MSHEPASNLAAAACTHLKLEARAQHATIQEMAGLWLRRSPKYGLKARQDLGSSFYCLYFTTGLLLIRNIYRVVEFSQASLNPPTSPPPSWRGRAHKLAKLCVNRSTWIFGGRI